MSAVMLKETAKNCAARSEFLLCLKNLLSFFYFLVCLVVVVVVLALSSNVTT